MSEWIKCSERLPEDRKNVLVWDGFEILIAHLDSGWWWFYENGELEHRTAKWVHDFAGIKSDLYYFKFWAPLPAPPTEE